MVVFGFSSYFTLYLYLILAFASPFVNMTNAESSHEPTHRTETRCKPPLPMDCSLGSSSTIAPNEATQPTRRTTPVSTVKPSPSPTSPTTQMTSAATTVTYEDDELYYEDEGDSEIFDQTPQESVRFILYDDSNSPNSSKEIKWDDGNSIRQVKLNGASRIKFFIHGFTSGAFRPNSQLIKNVYLTRYETRNQPVILVDWSALAGTNLYSYNTVRRQNVPAVASHVRQFISNLRSNSVIQAMSQIHLIGHSLGAQMSGLIGSEIQENHGGEKIGRISALDPAGPGYLNQPPENRVDETDAGFVDALHTSATLGIYRRSGQVDFFANPSQLNQPGCQDFICNHSRAVPLFAMTIYDRSIRGCTDRPVCTQQCDQSVVFGEHIDESVHGEYCFMERRRQK